MSEDLLIKIACSECLRYFIPEKVHIEYMSIMTDICPSCRLEYKNKPDVLPLALQAYIDPLDIKKVWMPPHGPVED